MTARTAVPVRSMIAGAAIAVAVLTGVVTFVSSLDHLLATPRLYGWNWDLTIGDGYGPTDARFSHIPIAKWREKRAINPAILRGILKIVGSADWAVWNESLGRRNRLLRASILVPLCSS